MRLMLIEPSLADRCEPALTRIAQSVLSAVGIGAKPESKSLLKENGDYGALGTVTRRDSGLAVMRISAPLAWFEDSYGEYLPYAWVASTARKLAADPSVKGVALVIDSPGGTASGIDEAASALEALSAAKPVAAFPAAYACSAAYWLAATSRTVAVAPDGVLGCIGTVTHIDDTSGLLAKLGIKRQYVADPDRKGEGRPGAAVTDDAVANTRERVSALASMFRGEMSRLRGIENAPAGAMNGDVFYGNKAVENGLADVLVRGGPNEFLSAVEGWMKNDTWPAARRDAKPSANKDTPMTKATFEQIDAKFGSDPAFVHAQYKAGATMEQAQEAWDKKRDAELKAANDRAAKAEADAAAAKADADKLKAEAAKGPATPGHDRPLATGGGGASDKSDDAADAKLYSERVAALTPTVGLVKAHGQAQKELPKAYAAYSAGLKPKR